MRVLGGGLAALLVVLALGIAGCGDDVTTRPATTSAGNSAGEESRARTEAAGETRSFLGAVRNACDRARPSGVQPPLQADADLRRYLARAPAETRRIAAALTLAQPPARVRVEIERLLAANDRLLAVYDRASRAAEEGRPAAHAAAVETVAAAEADTGRAARDAGLAPCGPR